VKRRGHHEGSIYQRGDGWWVAVIDLGWQRGRRRRKALYAKTRAGARAKLLSAQKDLAGGIQPGSTRLTVGKYLDEWLAAVASKVRPSTHRRYAQIVKHQLQPHLGRVSLSTLAPDDVEHMLLALSEARLSPRTAIHARSVLRTALRRAHKYGLVARNAAALADPPHVAHREVGSLAPGQIKQLLAVLDHDPMRAPIVLALASGLRSGEIRGLQWRDVYWDGATVAVRRTVQRIDGAFVVMEPKTARSRRTLPLPLIALNALRLHRELADEMPISSPYVFSQANGQPLHATTLWRAFQRALHAAGLPPMPFHALRHTAASLLLAEGIQPRVVMELLGHSTIRLTMDTYSHVMPALERDAADRMDRVLSG
jgi:integrase